VFIEEIEKRRAYRALSEEKIPEEVLERVLRAATYAPSCFNNQPWRFVAVTGDETLGRVKEHLAKGNYWAQKSPCIILVASRADLDCDLSDDRHYFLFDLGLASENLILQAFKEGLLAHPIAGFKPTGMKETVGIPEDYTLITCIILGYPGDETHLSEEHRRKERMERERKPLNEVVGFDRWIWPR
jgi:nitroreductase